MSQKILIALLPLAILSAAPAQAQDDTGERNIIGIEKAAITSSVPSDRPGFGDNTSLVPKGRFVLEAGYQFDDNQGGGNTYTAPSLLLRTGLSQRIELRLGFDGYLINAPGEDGAANARIGLKIDALDEAINTPALAIITEIVLPTGDDRLVSDEPEPEVRFVWSKGMTDTFGLSGNVNVAGRLDDNDKHKLETAASIAGGFQVADNLSSYVEYFGIFPDARGQDDTHAIQTGLAYLTSDATQLDASIGSGLNDTASDVFVSFGIAHLW